MNPFQTAEKTRADFNITLALVNDRAIHQLLKIENMLFSVPTPAFGAYGYTEW